MIAKWSQKLQIQSLFKKSKAIMFWSFAVAGLLMGSGVSAEVEQAVTANAAESDAAKVNTLRKIPAKAVKTVMGPPSNGFVTLGKEGKIFRLSAAAQIRDPNNKLLLPTNIEQQVPVKVLLDSYGAVWRVWILTAEEAKQKDASSGSTVGADK